MFICKRLSTRWLVFDVGGRGDRRGRKQICLCENRKNLSFNFESDA